MKFYRFLIPLLIYCSSAKAQVSYTEVQGTEITKHNLIDRIIPANENNFYCFRVNPKGKGTTYAIEKYDFKTLKMEFSKVINLPEEDSRFKICEIEYANGKVYIFRKSVDDGKINLSYQTVSSTGEVSMAVKRLASFPGKSTYFSDCKIMLTSSRTKFIAGFSYKDIKTESYTTNFILFDAEKDMAQVWKKTLNKNIFDQQFEIMRLLILRTDDFWDGINAYFLGLHVDDDDNLYYGLLEGEKRIDQTVYGVNVCIIKADEATPEIIPLKFKNNSIVSSVKFTETPDNTLEIAGFFKEAGKKPKDVNNVSLFIYTLDLTGTKIISKNINLFNDELMKKMFGSNIHYQYKLDYIIPVGTDIFYVGQQYYEDFGTVGYSHTYSDIIVAKLNAGREFEWMKNIPLNHQTIYDLPFPGKLYVPVMTKKGLYLLHNDDIKNLPVCNRINYIRSDINLSWDYNNIKLIASEVSLKDGSTHSEAFYDNKEYIFKPEAGHDITLMLPAEVPVYVHGKEGEVILYTRLKQTNEKFLKVKCQ